MEQKTKQETYVAQRIIGTIFGIIEAILAFRLIFKLLGANPGNVFVNSIYNFTHPFVGIFEGIFPQLSIKGAAGFEPETLIAMVVIALIAWAVMRLLHPSSAIENSNSTLEHDNKQ
ncbi:MAG: YggT family protein [Clostridiaceae bacterium]